MHREGTLTSASRNLNDAAAYLEAAHHAEDSMRAFAAAVLVLTACAANAPPVRVAGDAGGLAQLVGEWVGEYENPAAGRSGNIVFTLQAGDDHAHGDVMMTPRGAGGPLRPWRPEGMPPEAPLPRALTIEFVRVQGDSVTGMMSPYHDPECNCAVSTAFAGRISGATISGTFVSYRTGASGQAGGTWRVERR
jgi:hypothetical protein